MTINWGTVLAAAAPAAITGIAGLFNDRSERRDDLELLRIKQEFDRQKQERELAQALQLANISAGASRYSADASAGAQRYAANLGQQNNREALAGQAYESLIQSLLQGSRNQNDALGNLLGSLNRGGF